MDQDLMPVVGVRVAEGRCGSTLLMRLLGTSPQVVFDRAHPAEYRFLSYFERLCDLATEPFDASRHPGVTSFFFGPEQRWGPIPFESDVVADPGALRPGMLRGIWRAWTQHVRQSSPDGRPYAEKLAVPIETILDAGIPLRVIDLVRDPRDMWASIRAFTARGADGFGRRPGMSDGEHLDAYIRIVENQLALMADPPPALDRRLIRYEELATDPAAVAASLEGWLGIELHPGQVEGTDDPEGHRTTTSVDESIGRWRRDLSRDETDRIAAALGAPMARFGYAL